MLQFRQTVELVSGPETAANTPLPLITNAQIAEVLFNIATLLQMQQGNPYRIAAYQNSARALMMFKTPIADSVRAGVKLELPGLGERLRRKITELITTGRLTFYDDLCESALPADVRSLMALPRIGPKIATRLVNSLGIHSIAELYEAAHAQKLRAHHGFGPRSEQRLEEAANALLHAQPTQPEPPKPQAA